MTNEEIKALYESLHSVEDAYELMKKDGYTGTMEDFLALGARIADDISMDLDDMEQVAGGLSWQDVEDFGGAAVEKTKEIASKTWDWIQKNPGTAATIVGSTVAGAIGLTYIVKRSGGTTQQPVNRNSIDSFDNVGTPRQSDASSLDYLRLSRVSDADRSYSQYSDDFSFSQDNSF